MKLGEVVVTHMYFNFTKFRQNWMKTKKVLLLAHFSVQNFKVSLELWKSYIVPWVSFFFLYSLYISYHKLSLQKTLSLPSDITKGSQKKVPPPAPQAGNIWPAGCYKKYGVSMLHWIVLVKEKKDLHFQRFGWSVSF